MNDLVLTALINIFALFCTSSNLKRERAKSVIYNYLVRFFGIRNYQEYLDLYDSLCDLYELSDPDEKKIVSQVCDKLKKEIDDEKQSFMLLRLMEFSSMNMTAYFEQKHLFQLIAETFGITEQQYEDFEHFVEGKSGGNVGVRQIEELKGELKVLRSPEYNQIVVSFDGETQLFMNDIPMQRNIFIPWEKNGIIKSRHAKPLYYDFASNVLLGSEEKHEGITFAGRNVDFRFPNSKNGLHDFTFTLRSGELVAIMGGSGTGKSTMMGILSGSQKPNSGSITINGEELYDNVERLKPYIGFVPQDDLLIAELTVYQNLLYTARFCYDKLSEQELDNRINKTLQDLDLMAIKDLRVGSALNKSISGGQRKRLNIALELIREPQILFLDEPTSGLSSADSEKVIHLLKNQTYQGRLVITCIHQPSSDIYKLFDRLWLLDLGGYPIYDGNPIEAVSYFKTAANYADADTAICSMCGNINTEIVLNIVDAKALDSNGQFTDKRKVSPEEWNKMYKETVLKVAEERDNQQGQTTQKKALPENKQLKPNVFKQFWIYIQRNFHTKLQDRQFLLIALLEAPILAFIVALLTRYSGDNGYTLYDNKNLLSYVFMAVIVAIFMGMSMNAQEIFKDRALLKRESFLQLSYASYIFSKVVTAAVISLLQTLLFIIVGNGLLQLNCLFFQWWAVLFISSFLAGMTGLILSQRLKSLVAIYITIPLLLIPQILLCGVVVTFNDLNQHSKTKNVPWIGEIIPSRWAFEAITVTMFTDNDYAVNYFNNEQKQYELQMARFGIIHKLKELNEQERQYMRLKKDLEEAYFPLLTNEIQKLTEKWNVDPFPQIDKLNKTAYNEQIYQSLSDWLTDLDKKLRKQSAFFTRHIDKDKQAFINEHGNKALVELQYANTNKQLEQTLINSDAGKMVSVEEDVLVPEMGTVYLDPPLHNGRAPFYSSVKIIGDTRIQTLPFNLFVLIVMSVITIVILLSKSTSARSS
ncbi:MAG: ATP-binding cassette domain-containing protein [Bacteroidaceae bacterium]|nr:ATP-binding cassette domain-containing protein [Bacteroidaceae bacterium]